MNPKRYYAENCQDCPHREGGYCTSWKEYIGFETIKRCERRQDGPDHKVPGRV